ncbi:hypothetical protein AYI69_g8437 [Smittium culicis]|uniref:Uncharacterized protein n=1 Tax=Smittium culicis TaxID=133412 RepID=A0A1R1XJN7_9FUNG|nr:hypothetical protein AYI69_g8437 [Smittium culicis]
MIFRISFANGVAGDDSVVTSFHTSDGTPSAPGALLFGESRSASLTKLFSANNNFFALILNFFAVTSRASKVHYAVNGAPVWAAVDPSVVNVANHATRSVLIVPQPSRVVVQKNGNRTLFANSRAWEVNIGHQKLKFITIFGAPGDYPR